MVVPDIDAMKEKRSYELMIYEPEPVRNTGKIKTAACEVVCGLHLAAGMFGILFVDVVGHLGLLLAAIVYCFLGAFVFGGLAMCGGDDDGNDNR